MFVLSGVYPTTYIKHDKDPKKAHLKLIVERINIPKRPKINEKIKAAF